MRIREIQITMRTHQPRTDSGDEVVADAEAASLAPPRTDSDVPSSSWTVKKRKTFLRERGGKVDGRHADLFER